MIGGPTDLVVEPNIVRAVGARDVVREPARVGGPAEPTAVRSSAAIENGWPLQPAGEPTSVPAPRPYRSAATEEPWLAPEPIARTRPAESLTGLAAELSTRLNPPDLGAPVARNEPASRMQSPMAEPAAQADHNLAEMAHQLEAALRRAPAPEGRPPVTDPLAVQTAAAPGKGSAPARDFKARVEPKFETKAEPKFDIKPEPRLEPPATPGKNLYENLEEEMASLLGRPQGKT